MIHCPPNKYDLAFGTTSVLPEGISSQCSGSGPRWEGDPVTVCSHWMVNVPQVLLVGCAADQACTANLFTKLPACVQRPQILLPSETLHLSFEHLFSKGQVK